MKTLLIALLTIFGLLFSCNKKTDNRSTELRIENRILDSANLLTTVQEDSIFLLIKSLDNEVGSQIAIVTIDTLNGRKIEEYSLNVAEKLRIGRKKFNDGILITVARKDREMRIEVGYGLEKIVKDEIASQIIREEMAPRFREDDYAGGLMKGVRRVKKLIEDNEELVGEKL